MINLFGGRWYWLSWFCGGWALGGGAGFGGGVVFGGGEFHWCRGLVVVGFGGGESCGGGDDGGYGGRRGIVRERECDSSF